ncbi:MAG: hypothetical protein MZV64_56045 [Ignavibacteriales bacterium]|nr:hypothetical protein [Ignavibacteriales bacterium]
MDDAAVSITSVGGLVGMAMVSRRSGLQWVLVSVLIITFFGDDIGFDDYDGFAPSLRFDIGYNVVK